MSTGLKGLITTYSNAFLSSGGGEFELVQMCEALNVGGIETDIYGPDSRPLSYYDFVMHFSLHPSGYALLNEIRERGGRRIFLWPNVWWQTAPSDVVLQQVADIVNLADKLFFKTRAELDNFLLYMPQFRSKSIVLSMLINGFDRLVSDSSLVKTLVGFDEYILCVGRLEPIKRQYETIGLLAEFGVPLVMLGGDGDVEYSKKCKNLGVLRTKFLPFIQPRSLLLASLYSYAKAIVELSIDPPGRSALEAALFDRPILIQAGSWADEVFDGTSYCIDLQSHQRSSQMIGNWLSDAENKTKNASNRVFERHASLQAFEAVVRAIINEVA